MVAVVSDVFSNAHKAKARADEKQVEKDAAAQAKQATAKQMLDNMKPAFNDLPHYKFRDVFKLGLP